MEIFCCFRLLNDEHKDSIEEVDGARISGTYPDDSYAFSSPSRVATPGTNGKFSSGKPSATKVHHMTPFGQRTNKFVLQFEFNPPKIENGRKEEIDDSEDDVIRRVKPIKRCSLHVRELGPKPGCRFMYDKTKDRFESLEGRIRRLATALLASGSFDEIVDATSASQNNLFSVGMVCCDGDGRLNEKSIILQCSVEHSGGRRVRLDLQKLVQYSVFPGQVVGVTGHNPSGHCFVVSKLVDSFPILGPPDVNYPPAKRPAIEPEPDLMTDSAAPRELSLIIAAGPFCTSDNLFYEPFVELLSYARRNQSHLLLLGPFVDSEHPQIKKGTVDKTFDEIFDAEILERLQDYCEDMGSSARVILLPSTRDANHDFVFPQPPFDVSTSKNHNHQVSCLSNPGIFSANEVNFQFIFLCCVFIKLAILQVTVGCCTMDVLKQLSSEEISRLPTDGTQSDRLGRLATHILNQRRSVLSFGQEESMVQCMCLNPGRLAKGINGGTFLTVNYNGDPGKSTASIMRI
ncbi:DNA polymerase alpha subunit B [Nymphaea thermarum]|nr:DNA polymerase alpha subunit B [Nymphaea thermarum]